MFRPKSTLEQWRIFQAVVEQGGYAQAAEKLIDILLAVNDEDSYCG